MEKKTPLISLKDLRDGICICVTKNILNLAAGMGEACEPWHPHCGAAFAQRYH